MNDQITDLAIEFAKAEMAAFDAGHDWQHIERVRRMARYIQHKEEAGDPEIVELAAILHDIGDAKFREQDEEEGGSRVYRFLADNGFDREKAAHVRDIIEHISFGSGFSERKYDSTEFRIVQDADRLDAMGAIGIARAFTYGGFKNRPLFDPEILPRTFTSADEYRKAATPTLNHFYEKLFLLKDLMQTGTGRKIAEERHRYMVEYVERFRQEWLHT